MALGAIDATRNSEIGTLLAMLVPAAWFGFITWSALTYAFTGYYPLMFVRLWNATWGQVGKRLPLPPTGKRS